MPVRSIASLPAFRSSIQSSSSPCGSAIVPSFDAISSLMNSVVGVVPTSASSSGASTAVSS